MTRPAPQTRPPSPCVVAHPDDETFGCGSLLLHAAAAGARTTVVCATRGEAGGVAPGVRVPTSGIAALREAELRSAARALGVSEVELLGFTDSGMDGLPADGSLCGAPYAEVVTAVRSAVERHDPDVVVSLDGSDGHRDHARIRDAVVDAVAGSERRLYLHGLPRSLMHRWVRHHAGNPDAAAYVELPDIGTPDDQFTTVLDTSAHLADPRGRDRPAPLADLAVRRPAGRPEAGVPGVRAPDPGQPAVDRRPARARHLRRAMSSLLPGVITDLHTVLSVETLSRPAAPRLTAAGRPSDGRDRGPARSPTRQQDLQVRVLTVAGDPAALRLDHLAGLGDADAGLAAAAPAGAVRRRHPRASGSAGGRPRRGR